MRGPKFLRRRQSASIAMTTTSSRSLRASFWWACVLGPLPVAWAFARTGFGIPIVDPGRDLAFLAAASIAEEVVFRGGVQRALRHWRRRDRYSPSGTSTPAPWCREVRQISGANALASALFAATHLWNHPPLAALGVLPVSLLLGWVYERSDERLLPPVVLHLWFNGVLFFFSFYLAGFARAAA